MKPEVALILKGGFEVKSKDIIYPEIQLRAEKVFQRHMFLEIREYINLFDISKQQMFTINQGCDQKCINTNLILSV